MGADGAAVPHPHPELHAEAVDAMIPFRLRIGVTGHRTLPDSPALRKAIAGVVQRVQMLVPEVATTPIGLAIVSPLAEGADRLVAQVVLEQRNAVLEAVLPLAREDYLRDFARQDSCQEFDELLANAVRIVELPATQTREDAYEQAGRFVVEQSDLLIALWDGEPARGQGGTAEIVAWARTRGAPVFWVNTTAPFVVTEWIGNGIDLATFGHLDRFNRTMPRTTQTAEAIDTARAQIDRHAQAADIDPELLEPLKGSLLPMAVRADLLASDAQHRFFRFSDATFLLTVLAVLTSASPQLLGKDFLPTLLRIHTSLRVAPLIECVLLCVALVVIRMGHRSGMHQRWIAYRFLAERLRSAFFVALIDTVKTGADRAPELVMLHQPADPWMQRAFDEVWQQRPTEVPVIPCASLRRFLARAWIGDQRAYQENKSQRHSRAGHFLRTISLSVITVTIYISALDTFNAWRHGIFGSSGPTLVLYLSIVFPALAGALNGIGALRDHGRNAQRSTTMARRLERLERHMERAPDLPMLRAYVRQAEALMMEEGGDWFVNMQFRDVDLHT